MKPRVQLFYGARIADGEHLDVPVGQVDRVTGQTEGLGIPTRTLPEPDALYASFYGEETRGHEGSGFVLIARFFGCLARGERLGFRGKCLTPDIDVTASAQSLFRALQRGFGSLELIRRMLGRTCLPGNGNCLAGVTHFLNGGRGFTSGERDEQYGGCALRQSFQSCL